MADITLVIQRAPTPVNIQITPSNERMVANVGLTMPGAKGDPGRDGVDGKDGKDGNLDLLVASGTVLGGIKVGANLKIDESGVLSVDTAEAVEQDNTRPVTSAAVHMELGNVEVLLAAL